jgi:hypothetical protein
LRIALDFDLLEASGIPPNSPWPSGAAAKVATIHKSWKLSRRFPEKTLMLERMVKDATVGMTFGEELKSGKDLLRIARG